MELLILKWAYSKNNLKLKIKVTNNRANGTKIGKTVNVVNNMFLIIIQNLIWRIY